MLLFEWACASVQNFNDSIKKISNHVQVATFTATKYLQKIMRKINTIIEVLATKISKFETIQPDISKASVGWHIEHTLLTLDRITDELIKSKPEDYKWKFNFVRLVVFTMGKIPRGRGQSPKVVQPKSNLSAESLLDHLQATKQKIEVVQKLPSNKFFDHPFFGQLKLKDTIRFFEIHSKHHLKIIEDIISR
jgi:hypothetical protein